MKGGRICHPKICHFGIRTSLSYRHLNSRWRKGTLTLPFFFLKTGDKTPIWNMPSLHQKENNTLIKDRMLRLREFYTNLIKIILTFL